MSTFFLIFSPLKYNPSVWCWLSKKKSSLLFEVWTVARTMFQVLFFAKLPRKLRSEWAKEGGGQRLLISVQMVVEFHSVVCKIQLKMSVQFLIPCKTVWEKPWKIVFSEFSVTFSDQISSWFFFLPQYEITQLLKRYYLCSPSTHEDKCS